MSMFAKPIVREVRHDEADFWWSDPPKLRRRYRHLLARSMLAFCVAAVVCASIGVAAAYILRGIATRGIF